MDERSAEPTLADVAREFPDWHPCRGPSGLYYAGRTDTAQVSGEDPLDLRDQIRGWIGRHDDGHAGNSQQRLP
jgi:hypothetical protein